MGTLAMCRKHLVLVTGSPVPWIPPRSPPPRGTRIRPAPADPVTSLQSPIRRARGFPTCPSVEKKRKCRALSPVRRCATHLNFRALTHLEHVFGARRPNPHSCPPATRGRPRSRCLLPSLVHRQHGKWALRAASTAARQQPHSRFLGMPARGVGGFLWSTPGDLGH